MIRKGCWWTGLVLEKLITWYEDTVICLTFPICVVKILCQGAFMRERNESYFTLFAPHRERYLVKCGITGALGFVRVSAWCGWEWEVMVCDLSFWAIVSPA